MKNLLDIFYKNNKDLLIIFENESLSEKHLSLLKTKYKSILRVSNDDKTNFHNDANQFKKNKLQQIFINSGSTLNIMLLSEKLKNFRNLIVLLYKGTAAHLLPQYYFFIQYFPKSSIYSYTQGRYVDNFHSKLSDIDFDGFEHKFTRDLSTFGFEVFSESP